MGRAGCGMSHLPYSLDLFGPLAPSAEPEITPTPLCVGRGGTLVSRVRVDYSGLAILSLLAEGLLELQCSDTQYCYQIALRI